MIPTRPAATKAPEPASHTILTGHDPSITLEGWEDTPGVDLLLQEWREDGKVTRELAVRPGLNRREITWGAPVSLRTETQP